MPAASPPIDCFYVYPTVSRDPGLNSDMNAGPEENGATMVQFARFASVCRPFAPIYRQGTLASIGAFLRGSDPAPVANLAYADVLAAWRHYLRHRNNGRPFVLIGHSQGTIHLVRLLAEEIEGRPEAARMLSALLIGYNVEVPEGRVTGGSFRTTPLCTRAGQTGCVDHLRLVPRGGAAAGRRPVRPRRPAGPHHRLHQSGRARQRAAGAARFLLVHRFGLGRRQHDPVVVGRRAAGAVPSHRRAGLGRVRP